MTLTRPGAAIQAKPASNFPMGRVGCSGWLVRWPSGRPEDMCIPVGMTITGCCPTYRHVLFSPIESYGRKGNCCDNAVAEPSPPERPFVQGELECGYQAAMDDLQRRRSGPPRPDENSTYVRGFWPLKTSGDELRSLTARGRPTSSLSDSASAVWYGHLQQSAVARHALLGFVDRSIRSGGWRDLEAEYVARIIGEVAKRGTECAAHVSACQRHLGPCHEPLEFGL